MSDRFGDMGTVAVAVLDTAPTDAAIVAFVMSCRVFGYGIETAVIAELARRAGDKHLIGHFTPTKVNHLAEAMYPEHGFTECEATKGRFVWTGAPAIEMPQWLSAAG